MYYLTYDEYQQYGGTLDETAYQDVAFEAQSVINWWTFNRLQSETEYYTLRKPPVHDRKPLIHVWKPPLKIAEFTERNHSFIEGNHISST